MALITCPECGKEVSDQASKCPNCGYPLVRKNAAQKVRSKRKPILIGTLTALVLAAALVVFLVVLPDARRKSYRTVGGYVTFGTYPQTEDGTDKTPIEWLVLDYDAANHRALLISRYGLDAKPYNTEYVDITWEKCTLRIWLNNDFLNSAFTPNERKAILLTDVDNGSSQGYSGYSTPGGNNTQDRVFLLSCAEANKYLGVEYWETPGSDENLKSCAAPTAYAIKQGAGTSSDYKTADEQAAGWWWLRSPGDPQDHAALVTYAGSLGNYSVSLGYGCVRPAFWLNLESDIF